LNDDVDLLTIVANIPPQPSKKMLQLDRVLAKASNWVRAYFEVRLLMTPGVVSYSFAKANIAAIPIRMVLVISGIDFHADYSTHLCRNQSLAQMLPSL
jgi:hypothetical protein